MPPSQTGPPAPLSTPSINAGSMRARASATGTSPSATAAADVHQTRRLRAEEKHHPRDRREHRGELDLASRRTAASARSLHTLFVQGDLMSRYVAPAFLKRTRSHARLVLGGLILALVWASSTGAQGAAHPSLRGTCHLRLADGDARRARQRRCRDARPGAHPPEREPSDRAEPLRDRDRLHPAPESSDHCHLHPTGQSLGSDNSIVGATEPLKASAIGTLADCRLTNVSAQHGH